jgi:hypothetical protein
MSILFLWNENEDWRQTAKTLYCCVFNANLLCPLYFTFALRRRSWTIQPTFRIPSNSKLHLSVYKSWTMVRLLEYNNKHSAACLFFAVSHICIFILCALARVL